MQIRKRKVNEYATNIQVDTVDLGGTHEIATNSILRSQILSLSHTIKLKIVYYNIYFVFTISDIDIIQTRSVTFGEWDDRQILDLNISIDRQCFTKVYPASWVTGSVQTEWITALLGGKGIPCFYVYSGL